ncbi:MAG: hypothetical protein COC03_00830 [Robiginitomaculum sp.]|nr:MAG: hypothetical protein COC03_00830 [Robiginitomaculum sp.]
MLMFVVEITFLMELAVIASGLYFLGKARKDSSKIMKWAGWLLIIGGIGTTLCTWYYFMKYAGQGAFDTVTIYQNIWI